MGSKGRFRVRQMLVAGQSAAERVRRSSESSGELFAGQAAGEATADLSPFPSDSRILRKSSAVLSLEREHFGRVFVAADILTLCSSDRLQ